MQIDETSGTFCPGWQKLCTMATPEQVVQEVTSSPADAVTESAAEADSMTDEGTALGSVDDVMRQLDHELRSQYQEMETDFLAGNSGLAVDVDRQQYVQTPALEMADSILRDTGRVILCGPPGSGKSTMARALLRRCRREGFRPYTLRHLDEWDDHIGEDRPCVILLDGVLGEVCVNTPQHDYWKQILGTALVLMEKKTCRMVITVYPHILHELERLERSWKTPLRDSNAVVKLTDALPEHVKENMLHFHLAELHLDTETERQVVQTILQKDASGPVFPWCCSHMVNHWNSSEDPTAIFLVPAEAYAQLLKDMVLHKIHGEAFAAVLALSMKGVFHFLHHLKEAGRHLEELGFDPLSDDKLAVYADALQGSVLSEGGFSSRAVYEAAGLVLGRFIRLPTLLKVCDVPFLVKYVHMGAVQDNVSQDERLHVCVTVGSVPTCSIDGERCAVDRQSLVKRIYLEIIRGNMQAICQHPCLQSPEFLRELDYYCAKVRGRIKRLLLSVDSEHKLPLVYWSAFHPSHHLTRWCLSAIFSNRDSLSHPKPCAKVLLACALFDNLTRSSQCRLQPFVCKPSYFHEGKLSYPVVSFPWPETNQCPANAVQNHMETIINRAASEGSLLYLCNPSLPVPPDIVTVHVTHNHLQLRIRDKSLWYLMFRLMADRQPSDTDKKGDTLLHIAARTREAGVMRLCLNAGAGITQKNRGGATPIQLAPTAQISTVIVTGLCRTGHDSPEDIANLCTELGADAHATYTSSCQREKLPSDTIEDLKHTPRPLHWACVNGLVHSVDLLLRHKADVNMLSDDWVCAGMTALHLACRWSSTAASADITRLLLKAGAEVDARDFWEYTPLHYAASMGYTATTEELVRHGADVNAQNSLGSTPLLLAVKYGHSSTAEVLIHHGADVNYQNTWGKMIGCLGQKLRRLLSR